MPPWIVLASTFWNPSLTFCKTFSAWKLSSTLSQNLLNYFENLMKTPWLCWNHLKTFLASFMPLLFLFKTFWCQTWKLFHLMCRTFPPFQFHFTKELSKISLTQLCCRLFLQEKTSKLGVKLKNASKLVHFQLSPRYLWTIFIMYIMPCVFSKNGVLALTFSYFTKKIIIHPILITYFEISNNPILEVNLFIISCSSSWARNLIVEL